MKAQSDFVSRRIGHDLHVHLHVALVKDALVKDHDMSHDQVWLAGCYLLLCTSLYINAKMVWLVWHIDQTVCVFSFCVCVHQRETVDECL